MLDLFRVGSTDIRTGSTSLGVGSACIRVGWSTGGRSGILAPAISRSSPGAEAARRLRAAHSHAPLASLSTLTSLLGAATARQVSRAGRSAPFVGDAGACCRTGACCRLSCRAVGALCGGHRRLLAQGQEGPGIRWVAVLWPDKEEQAHRRERRRTPVLMSSFLVGDIGACCRRLSRTVGRPVADLGA